MATGVIVVAEVTVSCLIVSSGSQGWKDTWPAFFWPREVCCASSSQGAYCSRQQEGAEEATGGSKVAHHPGPDSSDSDI